MHSHYARSKVGPPGHPPRNNTICFQVTLLPPPNFHFLISPPTGYTFPMSEKVNKRSLIETYIEAHPGYTLTEVARECGVSRAMVSIVRKEHAIRNKVMAGARTPSRSLDEAGDTPSTQTFAEVIQKVLSGQGRKLTPLEQAQVYSELSIHPKAQPGTVIAALNGLRALEASAQQSNDIGPGVPLTHEGKVHRLSLLLMAVGPELAAEAWEKAYPSLTPPPETYVEPSPNLEATAPIPEGTHDALPMATEGEAPIAEDGSGAHPDPVEEPGDS